MMLAARIGALFALLVFSTSTFAAPPVKFGVQVDLTGNGTVTSSPGGISCPTSCFAYFKQAATITLTAAPATGETFLGWGGACSGTGSCTIPSIQGDVQVAAQFSSNGGGGGGGGMTMVPEGTEPNSLLYWNGAAWAELLPPAADTGIFRLEWVNGGLIWSEQSTSFDMTVDIPGTTRPWDQLINSQLVFDGSTSDYQTATPPISISLNDLGVLAGEQIEVACVGGTTNAGGLPSTDCRGLLDPYGPTDDNYQPACNSFYPSKFLNSADYPARLFQIIGSFVDGTGVVLGQPFLVPPVGRQVTVPFQAASIQFGFNECLYRDNSASPLTVSLKHN